ncbi:hypothetical protein V8E54_014931 [Elaphomyces granulatus]
MAASPWAKDWKSLASDSSQKAFLLATFYKTFGSWPTDIPKEAVQKLVAGRDPDEILQSRRLRTPRPQDDLTPATLGASSTGDPIAVDDGDDTPPPTSGAGQKRRRVDSAQLDVNAVLLASNHAALQQLTQREPNRDRAALTDQRDEYRYFKHFEDWSNGFILLVAIMLEIFKLPALAAAQLRFYQEVVDANDFL